MIFIAVTKIARFICFYYYLLIGSSVKNVNDKGPVAIFRDHSLCFIHSLKQKFKSFEIIHVVWQRNIWISYFDVADILWDKPNSKWHTYTNPRPGQYLAHAHSHITQAAGAIASCFTLIKAHQHGMSIGPMNEQRHAFCVVVVSRHGEHRSAMLYRPSTHKTQTQDHNTVLR